MVTDDGKSYRLEHFGFASFDKLRKLLPDPSTLDVYNKKGAQLSDPIPTRFPIRVLEQIEGIRRSYGIRTRSETIVWLLKNAILLEGAKDKIQDPQLLQQLKTYHESVKAVEWVSTLASDKLDALSYVFNTEKEIRRRR